jgi:O-antigen/teichoic acid export membrane protein
MSAFSSPIVSIFYTPQFSPAAGALQLLSLASVFFILSQLLMGFFYGMGKPKLHTFIITAVLLLDVALNYGFITMFGLRGAAAATLIARAIEVVVLFTFITVRMKSSLVWADMVKPAMASLAIYVMASLLAVNGIVDLVAYGIGLIAVYVGIMIAIKGMAWGDVKTVFGWARSALRV